MIGAGEGWSGQPSLADESMEGEENFAKGDHELNRTAVAGSVIPACQIHFQSIFEHMTLHVRRLSGFLAWRLAGTAQS